MTVSTFATLVNKGNNYNFLFHYWCFLMDLPVSEQRTARRKELCAVLLDIDSLNVNNISSPLDAALSNPDFIYSVREDTTVPWDRSFTAIKIVDAIEAIEKIFAKLQVDLPEDIIKDLRIIRKKTTSVSLFTLISIIADSYGHEPEIYDVIDKVVCNHPTVLNGEVPLNYTVDLELVNGVKLRLVVDDGEFARLHACSGVVSCRVVPFSELITVSE